MSSTTAEQHIQAMKQGFQAGKARGLRVTYQLQVTGTGGGIWTISVADGQCTIREDALAPADITIVMSGENFLKIATGKLNLTAAYQQGQIQVEGNPQLAHKFAELFPPWASSVSSGPAPASPPTQPASPAPSPSPAPAQPASPAQPTSPAPSAPSPAPAQPAPAPAQPASSTQPASPAPATPTLADYVAAMPNGLWADRARGVRIVYQFQLSGSGGGTWTISVADGRAAVAAGAGAANVVIGMSGSDFIKLARGNLNPTQAYQQGRIQISGDINWAARIVDIFGPWAGTVGAAPAPMPAPTPAPAPAPSPAPTPVPTPTAGSAYPRLMNGSFDEYQPFVYKGQAKVWKEPQFPEEYGKYWALAIHKEGKGRLHVMNSGVFGRFTQKYFRGGGRDYHIHGRHSQVVTSRYQFKITFSQTVTARPGREYTFSGSIVSFYKGTSGERADGKIFKAIGIDPTGGREYYSDKVVWSQRDGKDNEWRYPSVKARAQTNAITVHILLENVEKDVGETELNIVHLDNFKLD